MISKINGGLSINHDFSNKTIIVTGAASGMGRATTLRLREYGATVYSADRNHSALKETCEQSGAEPCVIDISKAAECNALVERAKTEQGKLDGIVNFSSIWSEIAAMLASGRGLHNILNEPTDFYY